MKKAIMYILFFAMEVFAFAETLEKIEPPTKCEGCETSQYTLYKVKDGGHKDMYLLKGYKYDDDFNTYFTVTVKGSIVSSHTSFEPTYSKVNLKEKITQTAEGKNITMTRNEWYNYFTKLNIAFNDIADEWVRVNFHSLWDEYYGYVIAPSDVDSAVERYINDHFKADTATNTTNKTSTENKEDDYCKKPDISKEEAKFCNMNAEDQYIKNATKPMTDEEIEAVKKAQEEKLKKEQEQQKKEKKANTINTILDILGI